MPSKLYTIPLNTSVIYRAKCTCGKTYIRETKRLKLRSKKGRRREQISQLQTGLSPRKTPNPRIHMEHCMHREKYFWRKVMEGLLIACENQP